MNLQEARIVPKYHPGFPSGLTYGIRSRWECIGWILGGNGVANIKCRHLICSVENCSEFTNNYEADASVGCVDEIWDVINDVVRRGRKCPNRGQDKNSQKDGVTQKPALQVSLISLLNLKILSQLFHKL